LSQILVGEGLCSPVSVVLLNSRRSEPPSSLLLQLRSSPSCINRSRLESCLEGKNIPRKSDVPSRTPYVLLDFPSRGQSLFGCLQSRRVFRYTASKRILHTSRLADFLTPPKLLSSRRRSSSGGRSGQIVGWTNCRLGRTISRETTEGCVGTNESIYLRTRHSER